MANVFQDRGYEDGPPQLGSSMKQQCKRDYEGDIAALSKMSAASIALKDAILGYIDTVGRGNKAFTLTDLYGALSLEIRAAEKGITRLQEEWEADK